MSRSLRLGSLSRQRRNNLFTVGGPFNGSRPQSGSFNMTAARISEIASPLKALSPVSIS